MCSLVTVNQKFSNLKRKTFLLKMRFLRYCGTEQRKVDHVNQFEPISPLCFAMLKDLTLFREYLKSLINSLPSIFILQLFQNQFSRLGQLQVCLHWLLRCWSETSAVPTIMLSVYVNQGGMGPLLSNSNVDFSVCQQGTVNKFNCSRIA